MNCDLSESTLHGYFDGELDAVRAAEFEQHLKSCPECERSFRLLGSLRNGLRERNLYQPASLRLRKNIAEQLAGESSSKITIWRWLLVPAFSVVIAIVIVGAAALLLQSRTGFARLQ